MSILYPETKGEASKWPNEKLLDSYALIVFGVACASMRRSDKYDGIVKMIRSEILKRMKEAMRDG